MLTLLTFVAVPVLRKNIKLSLMVSLWCELISIYTLKNQWITIVSKIWVGMSTTNIHLLQFNFKSLAKTRTLNAGTLELIPKKNCLKFQHYISHFAHANTLTKLPSWVLWSLLLFSTLQKWFILTQRTQNLQIVNIKCVAYAQPITLPLNWLLGKIKINKENKIWTPILIIPRALP